MPGRHDYVTVDVFTDRAFAGNPLAVVTDATGLTPAQMQAIAAEFNYSESTFVLPPEDPAHTARVRIFTRQSETAGGSTRRSSSRKGPASSRWTCCATRTGAWSAPP